MTGRRTSLLVGLAAGTVLSLVFVTGFISGAVVDRHETTSIGASDPNVRDFLAAYRLVTQQSYYRPFNRHQLVNAAIDAMLSATGDPHTIYLSPPQNKSADQELNGAQFSGIGAIVVPHKGVLQVLALVPRAPAARAGLHEGDVVTRINGKPVSALTGNEAISRIHGPAGSTVRLTIRRSHRAPFVVPVVRAQIAPITAYGRLLSHHLGYIQIFSFGATTSKEVADAVRGLTSAHVRGIVLDLRANPGGYVQSAQEIVSLFLSRGVVAYEKRSDKSLTALNVIPGDRLTRVPLAILVDGETASAAEITAAALEEEDHAVLVGSRTYGKGSMQSVYSLSDGSTVRVTDRLWLTPHKHSINKVGLQPTFLVPAYEQGMPAGADPPLTTAERYLERTAKA